MKKILIFMLLLGTLSHLFSEDGFESGGFFDESPKVEKDGHPENDFFLEEEKKEKKLELKRDQKIIVSVVGQGVAPTFAVSPAQSFALAKRAAVGDAYRLIAEKVKGVHVEGKDTVENMMIKKSTVRTLVSAMVRNAEIVETIYKEGLCEVEMEIELSYGRFE